ncbi:MAG: DUF222 domain-containing protein, partial [Acidimicrobiales bacterium]|nr:DUF222 domain-containing protein [Acidimicrobiales bacterium]
MELGLRDPEVAAAVAAANSGFDGLFASGLTPTDYKDAITCVKAVEALRRRADAAMIELMNSIEQDSLMVMDGHSSAKTFVRHHGKVSGAEAAGRDKAMRACRALPNVRREFQAGRVGSDQIRLLGKVHANPRVRGEMPANEAWFLRKQKQLSFADFEDVTRRWVELVDENGPEPKAQIQHENRNVSLHQDFDGSWTLKGNFGNMQGAQINEIFGHYVEAELLADWDKAKAEHGDDATQQDLPRTPQQRRADAFWQLNQDAASSLHGATPPGFVHNIIWDADTFEEMANRLLDPDHEAQPIDVDTYRCETLDGVQLNPVEAIVSAIQSRIRRCLVDAKSVIIDLGEARFFTGNARHAIKLAHTHCVFAGCDVPSSKCEADHLLEHSK